MRRKEAHQRTIDPRYIVGAGVLIGGVAAAAFVAGRIGEFISQPPPDIPPIAGPAIPGAAAEQEQQPTNIERLMTNPDVKKWLEQLDERTKVTVIDYGPNRQVGWVGPEEGLNERVAPDRNVPLRGAYQQYSQLSWSLEMAIERDGETQERWAATWLFPSTQRAPHFSQTGFTALIIGDESYVSIATPQSQPSTIVDWPRPQQ